MAHTRKTRTGVEIKGDHLPFNHSKYKSWPEYQAIAPILDRFAQRLNREMDEMTDGQFFGLAATIAISLPYMDGPHHKVMLDGFEYDHPEGCHFDVNRNDAAPGLYPYRIDPNGKCYYQCPGCGAQSTCWWADAKADRD